MLVVQTPGIAFQQLLLQHRPPAGLSTDQCVTSTDIHYGAFCWPETLHPACDGRCVFRVSSLDTAPVYCI